MEEKLHPLLEKFISEYSWDHGHSAGQLEIDAIAQGLRSDLRAADTLINELLEYKFMYEGLTK